VVDVSLQDVGRPANLSCDVQSNPAAAVRWRCCAVDDRDVPDSVLYEKVTYRRCRFYAATQKRGTDFLLCASFLVKKVKVAHTQLDYRA